MGAIARRDLWGGVGPPPESFPHGGPVRVAGGASEVHESSGQMVPTSPHDPSKPPPRQIVATTQSDPWFSARVRARVALRWMIGVTVCVVIATGLLSFVPGLPDSPKPR